MVEPDARLARALRDELLTWGHLSTTATSTMEGLASALRQAPDLVLLDGDSGRDELDGFVAALGALGPRTPPIVVMSEEPTAPIWQVVGILRKPVAADALESVVGAVAGRGAGAHPL